MIERILGVTFLIAIVGFFVRHKSLPWIVSLLRIYPLFKYFKESKDLAVSYSLHNGVYLSLAFDGYSAFLITMLIIVYPFIAMLDEDRYLGSAMLAEAALMGVFLARDAVLMMIFREISLIAVLLMVFRSASGRTAMMYLAFAQAGALLALIPIFYGFYHAGSSTFVALRGVDIPKKYVLAAVLGFGIEVPLFPLHSRFIRTISESNVSTATLLMFRNGIFGIFRILYIYPITADRSKVFFRRGTISVFYAYLSAFGTDKIRELIAYLAVGHMSFARIAVPKLGIATTGALYYMSVHPLILAPLLSLSVALRNIYGTEHLLEIKDMLQKPVMGISIALALLLAASVPVSAGFVGEILTIIGMMSYGTIAILPVFAPVILMSVSVYYIREVLYGPKDKEGKELTGLFAAVVIILIVVAFAIVLRTQPIECIKEVVSYV